MPPIYDYEREADDIDKDNTFREWFNENKRALRKEFCDLNEDKFIKYIKEQFDLWSEGLQA